MKVYRKLKNVGTNASGLIVEFTGRTTGKVVYLPKDHGTNYTIGHYSQNWADYKNKGFWEVCKAPSRLLSKGKITHFGGRVENTGICEKCENETNWIIEVDGVLAYWCGC